MAQNRAEHVAIDGTIGMASSKLNQRGHHGQATQASQLIGIVENTRLQRQRIPLFWRQDRCMCQENLLNPVYHLILNLMFAQKTHSNLSGLDVVVLKTEFNS